MNTKKWAISLIAAVLATLMAFGGIMVFLDPLLNYGPEKDFMRCYRYSTIYSNPGIAKHYDYDTVLVGTSMIQNTNVDLCDELFDCDMVRLPYPGGTSYDMKTILDLCFASDNDIKTVYWELDQFQLTNSATEHRQAVPEYLYTDSVLDDLPYVLNLEIFYRYGLLNIINGRHGERSDMERRGITLWGTFNKENALANYSRPKEQAKTVRDFHNTHLQTVVDANLANITVLVEANPDTEFVFFMPPFSVMYWDYEIRNGKFESTLDATEYAMTHLLEYDNVRIYYYQAEEDIITDLDNYKDFSHYGNWTNDTVTEYIAADKCRVTGENCADMIQKLRDLVYAYDFEALFGE